MAMKKDLISLFDCTDQELMGLIRRAQRLKVSRADIRQDLRGQSVALVFQKPSNRTRVSFAVGIHELGGYCVYLGPDEISLGKRETTHDVAKTLSRYVQCIVARVFDNTDIVALARYADVPVINALCDLYHPCQALADIQTIHERFGRLSGLTVAYVGDGNNVFHSLLTACVKTGVSVRFAGPAGYDPSPSIVARAREIAKANHCGVELGRDPQEAVKGVHVIYSDVWVSMGQEKEKAKRIKDFKGYQIHEDLAKVARKDYIFMHCLPAHRGLEVSAGVIDGKHSVVFDQAENRLHAQKAVLLALMKRRSSAGKGNGR